MSSRFSCPSSFALQPPITSYVDVTVKVYDNSSVLLPGASVRLVGNSYNHTGITDGSGSVLFTHVGAPSPNATFHVDATGFDPYDLTRSIETLPSPVTYVIGPAGTAVAPEIQLRPLVTGGSGGVCNVNLAIAQPAGIPARPNLRWFRGNFIGIIVPGLPPVDGGSGAHPDLLLTPFIDRYAPADQALAIAAYQAHNYTHWVLWWPDSRAFGQSIAQFVATCQMIQAAGFYTVVNLLSKVYDPRNPDPTQVAAAVDGVVAALEAVNAADAYIVGFELDLWTDPGNIGDPSTNIQDIIDHVVGLVDPAVTPVYVHFSSDVASWQRNGTFTADFWNPNVGKLTGLLYQHYHPTCPGVQNQFLDVQVRFGGAYGFSATSGFGHPFDVVAFEQGANNFFNGTITYADVEAQGFQAIYSPVPSPGVPVMGYGNGCTGDP
jgi:hypothetical protein